MDFAPLLTTSSLIALITLTFLEIVLGIDNIVFISILAGKLPVKDQNRARLTGISIALITRILLLFTIGTIAKLTYPVVTLPLDISGVVPDEKAAREILEISWRDIIFGVGGLFLIFKSVSEIHHKLDQEEAGEEELPNEVPPKFWAVIGQILVLDIVFSLDSVITAVGLVDKIPIMVAAVTLSVIFMLFLSGTIARYIETHSTLKMLALAFLLLIGVNLIGEAAGQHIPKGYTYFAMGFAVLVESLNLRLRKLGMNRRNRSRGEEKK
ncbi:MAG: hypothetical protein C4320_00780 [Armatimonadota bacterium]